MKAHFKFIALILVLLMIIPLTSCSKNDDAYLYFQFDSVPHTLDPQTAKSREELLVTKNIYEGLMRFDVDGKLICAVAESYKKQGLTFTFKLRENAKWKNGEQVTAHDFVFGFKRAVNPETAAPFVSLLYPIKNAKKISNNQLPINELGVTAINDDTLKIELEYDDKNFLNNLTYPVAMPCNKEFFISCKGKYGLDTDYILSNGSYRLSKWGQEIFGIRLYRHDEYTGPIKAKNAAVFISQNKELNATQSLAQNDADIAFVNTSDVKMLTDLGFKTAQCENTVWFLTIGEKLPLGIRKSLGILSSSEVFASSMNSSMSAADTLFPDILNANTGATGLLTYNLETAKKLYTEEIKKMDDKSLPKDIKLYYYNNTTSKSIVTSIVGHWQNHLGAYINIESVSSPDLLIRQLKDFDYYMAIFPVRVATPSINEYLLNFGIDYDGQDLKQIQQEILKSNNVIPLAFENEIICYSPALQNVKFINDTVIDFAFIVKNND